MQAAEPEVPLTGGRSTPGVRVGGTVRRPRKPDSGRIHRLLTAATSRNSTTPGTISQGWFIS
jgi:hypothetical protein